MTGILTVTYKGLPDFKTRLSELKTRMGYSTFEKRLEKLLHKDADGMGYCFGRDTRDITWSWTDPDSLLKATAKIQKHLKIEKDKRFRTANVETRIERN